MRVPGLQVSAIVGEEQLRALSGHWIHPVLAALREKPVWQERAGLEAEHEEAPGAQTTQTEPTAVLPDGQRSTHLPKESLYLPLLLRKSISALGAA